MNGTQNHVHILLELHPTVSLSNLMRDMKACSSGWIKSNKKMPLFKGWGREYAAFVCSFNVKEIVYAYIVNQQEHHKKESFEDEFARMIKENGLIPCKYNE